MSIAALIAGLAAATSTPPSKFEPAPCIAPAPSPSARCGVVEVPENRAEPDGRIIALNVIVLPAVSGADRLPPLFDIDGGPGLPGTKNAGFYAFNGVSKGRDVVLIDQRGTGRSNPLTCPELASVKPTEPMLPRAAVVHCRDALARRADLRFYGTRDAVTDLDSVRQALGYEKIDLFGLSYGTTVALAYMRRHPERVRAAVLMGTAPPEAMPPRQHAQAAARALALTVQDCRADAACSGRFPDLERDVEKAKAAFARSGGSPELLMERLRTMMYTPAARAKLPLAIERAAAGDMSLLFGGTAANGASMIADGMFLAVTCGESFALMDYDRSAAAARETPFGDYRLRRQREACEGWPRVALDPDHLKLPTSSAASVLLLSGNIDPVTPPDWAERVAKALPRARHVVIPAGAHVPDGLSDLDTCLDPLIIAFLDRGDPAALDGSCVERMKPAAYVLEQEAER